MSEAVNRDKTNMSESDASTVMAERPGAYKWIKQLWQRLRRVFAARPAGAERLTMGLTLRSTAIEWLVVLCAVLLFCAPFLDLDSTRALPGNESEVFQSLDWTLVNSLKQFGEFPLWNWNLRTGFPLVADPFLHIYNPLTTLPVLALGVPDGFKIALCLSILAAGLGMWWLGASLGFGGAARLWTALMYAFTGTEAARFFQGSYDFVLGYAWIPWSIAFLLLALRTGKRAHIVGAVVALALLFFSGNVYYSYYMVIVVFLVAAVYLFSIRRRPPHVVLYTDRVVALAIIGALTLALAAIQLLPLLDYWGSLAKTGDPQLMGSHTLPQIILDYVSRDPQRPDAIRYLPSEEFYAYIGVLPLLLVLLLPVALRKHSGKPVIFFGLLVLVSFAWIAGRYMPWHTLHARIAILSQFRYPTRMLIYGSVGILVLAGMTLDALWQALTAHRTRDRLSVPALARWGIAWAGILVVGGLMLFSVADVFATNRTHIHSRSAYLAPDKVMAFVREYDPSEFFVSAPNGWHRSAFSSGLRYLDAWYGFDPVRPTQGWPNRRPVEARPLYVILGNDQRPEQPEASLVRQFSDHSVWLLPNSLPFAFLAQEGIWSEAAADGSELTAAEVHPVQPVSVRPNRVELVATAEAGDTLVLLQTALRGWQLEIDGKKALPGIVGGYLATAAQPGQHRYVFTFRPLSFFVGLVISLVALAVIALLLASPVRRAVQQRRKQRITGTYRGGVFVPDKPVSMQEGAPVQLMVEPIRVPEARTETGLAGRIPRAGWILFGASLLVYAVTRLIGIERFPIYFFTDEATFALLANELLSHGLRDGRGTLLPLYFEVAGNRWTPVLAVYVHLPAVALFGRSILAVRATSALVTLLAPIAVALILKLIFRVRYWWAGALLTAVVPTWFLHSRTAFEWMMMASFYACFLLFYLLYRTRSPNYLFAAIAFGAGTFYNHASGQLVMAAVAILLAASDFRYHLKNWRTVLLGLLMILLLAVPVLRLRAQQPEAMLVHLRAIDSYWFRDVPIVDKLQQFASTYLYGLSPGYWFLPNQHDLVRHRMNGYGNLGLLLLPLVLAGTLLCLRRVRSSTHRAVLFAAMAAPAGAAMADVAITRMMAFVPPVCVIAGLGLDLILEWVRKTLQSSRMRLGASEQGASRLQAGMALVVFAILSGAGLWMLHDALTNGPTWYRDYGLYGMQYGARQLFVEAIPQYLEENPDATMLVSPNWANGADTFVRFFFPPEEQFSRVQMHDVSYFMDERRELSPNMVFVMTSDEYEKAKASPKFSRVDVDRIVPYPDGRPGFYFVRLAYSENVNEIMAQERDERRRPVAENIDLGGQLVSVTHSPFDGGQLRDLFDGDSFTLARGLEANPLVLEFDFPQTQQIGAIAAQFGSGDYSVEATYYREGEAEPTVVSKDFRGLPPDPRVVLDISDRPERIQKLRLAFYRFDTGEPAHIHVRELQFLASPQ
jgi:hypothetical protein